MLSIYPACFYKEKSGGYSVIFPVLDIATCGDTLDEAMEMAVDCLAGYLYDAHIEKLDVPPAPEMSEIDVNAEYDEYECAFVNLVSVDVQEYAKKHFNHSVKKTLTIPEWLNTKAVEQGINFSAVLQKALMNELHLS